MNPGGTQATLNLEWRVVMRKSGLAAAAGLGSLVLLLTACGGSSGSSSPTTTSTAQPGAQGTSGLLNGMPAPGSTVLHVQKSALGYVLALTNGQVVYMYDKDSKGGTPACTGSCASIWLPVTGGKPVVSPADTGLGTLGTVTIAGGAKQVTYNGMPLYTYKGAKVLTTTGNGIGGMWHVVKLSKGNIVNT
jgi:predicted lipoprotein with Yx(FWY)xxD motif